MTEFVVTWLGHIELCIGALGLYVALPSGPGVQRTPEEACQGGLRAAFPQLGLAWARRTGRLLFAGHARKDRLPEGLPNAART